MTQIRDARLPGDADGLARVHVAGAEHPRALDPARCRVPDVAVAADVLLTRLGFFADQPVYRVAHRVKMKPPGTWP